jgi:hypothetical protein
MGFRFYRRIRIAPGLTLNLTKRNVSMSVGSRGAHYTVGTAGRRVTVGIPGTGMYWTEKLGDASARQSAGPARPNQNLPAAAAAHYERAVAAMFLAQVAAVALIIALLIVFWGGY